MSIVLIEDAPSADCVGAGFTEVLYFLLKVPCAASEQSALVDASVDGLGKGLGGGAHLVHDSKELLVFFEATQVECRDLVLAIGTLLYFGR